ncbi:MAG: BtpA/SgcQ family protein, partial [Gloeomargarita sp. DG02_4_bins_56]
DAVILSGWATGHPPTREDLELARAAAGHVPVLVGSGANAENVANLLTAADGVIVASSLKRRGQIEQPIDPQRVGHFVQAVRRSREPEGSSLSPIHANESPAHTYEQITQPSP